MPNNKFARYAYSPSYEYNKNDLTSSIEYANNDNNMTVFSGGDLQAYINNIKVGNLESVTWSISVEVVGNYVMGRRDAVVYTTGKRVVVGSMVLSQYDRHALLEQVFNISKLKLTTIGALWTPDTDTKAAVGQLAATKQVTLNAPTGVGAQLSTPEYVVKDGLAAGSNNVWTSGQTRGISRGAYEEFMKNALVDTARAIGSTKFNYSDQLPPFDLTLVGVTKAGQAARCSIFGLQVTQETAGFSQNDLGNSVGMSFVALAVSPWRAIELGDGGAAAYIPPSA